MSAPISVMWLGLRGFPNVQGGVETHAEHVCPILVELGCAVEVVTRAPYQPKSVGAIWRGVRLRRLWIPRSKSLETLAHTFLGVLYAGLWRRPDVLHLQAIGAGLMAPLARLMCLRVVVTHHGPDYDRQKWGRVARAVLRLGERFGMRWAHERIAISEVIRTLVRQKHGRSCALISNGVVLPDMPDSSNALTTYGLQPGRYVLLVGRMVVEKRHLDLIAAFERAALPGWKLVIVGGPDHPDAYSKKVVEVAAAAPGIVCTGVLTGLALRELYAHAGMFVLPSSHEGLPIALLEALSYGLPALASDIPANREVGLDAHQYFSLGNIAELADKIAYCAEHPPTPETREMQRAWVAQCYDWRDIAKKTYSVYLKVTGSQIAVHDAVTEPGRVAWSSLDNSNVREHP